MYHDRSKPVQASSISITGLTVEEIYRGQKEELSLALRRVLETAFPLDFDIQSISRLMHNLAGTAAYFNEDRIGHFAARLEHPLRSANNTADIQNLCGQMLAVLD